MFKRLFKKENKKPIKKENKTVYVDLHWVGKVGRTYEKMSENLLNKYVEEGIVFEDYEIIDYL